MSLPRLQNRFFALVLGALILLFSDFARAYPPTYGSEFNFTSMALSNAWNDRGLRAKYEGISWQVPGDEEMAAAKAFAEKVKDRCGGECTVVSHTGKFRSTEYLVTFADGYRFNISVDPACVEIQTNPGTLEQIKKYEKHAQKFIFEVASELGMTGSNLPAHFNIGLLSAFENDPKGFMKFFVNYHNAPELSLGVLGSDPANAPPVSHLRPSQRAALAKIVDDVNADKIATPQELAMRIQKEVYTHSPIYDAGEHFQGVSVKSVTTYTVLPHDSPFELRAPRQPETAKERTLLAEFFEMRIAFEKKSDTPIAFLDVPKMDDYSPHRGANRFRLYLAEMGADWDHFKALLPMHMREVPADPFLSGKINWSSPADVGIVKSYAEQVASSDWVRKRMKSLISTPEAAASGRLPEILDEISHSLGENANLGAKAQLVEFLRSFKTPPSLVAAHAVLADPPEQVTPQNCQGFFAKLASRLWPARINP